MCKETTINQKFVDDLRIKRNIVHQAYLKALVAKDQAWVKFQSMESEFRIAERQLRKTEIAKNTNKINKENVGCEPMDNTGRDE